MKVSVLIACYNGAGFIAKALESAFSQTLPAGEYEVVLVDDGSTDATEEAIAPYRQRPNFRALKNAGNLGLARACNRALEVAQGEYVIRLDADDAFDPALLEELLREMEKGATDFVSCDRRELNLETGEMREIRIEPFNLFRLIAIGTLMRRELLMEIGGWRDLFLEEYDLYLRYLSQSTRPPVHLRRPLLTYTIRPGSMTADPVRSEEGWRELRRLWPQEVLRKQGAPA